MLDEKTIEELHSYYDRLPGGICLVKADDSEERGCGYFFGPFW